MKLYPAFTGLLTLSTFGLVPLLHADVSLPKIFADHLVLQQGQKVPVWGWAEPGEEVTVKFAGQEKKTKTGADKHWKVELDPLKISAEPAELTVSGKNSIGIKDVLVGEVWVASGQSNMEMNVGSSQNLDQEKAAASHPLIRMFTVQKVTAGQPKEDVAGSWEISTADTISHFSAVGYFFARDVQKEINEPIGIIHTSWGGTPSEAWTSAEALKADPAGKQIAETAEEQLKNYNPEKAKADYEKNHEAWKAAVEKVKAENAQPNAQQKPLPGEPHLYDPTKNPNLGASLFNGMIYPIIPFAIKGALWYQGESNSSRAYQYRAIFPDMIKDWRQRWGSDFPFYFVQLANFQAPHKEAGTGGGWQELQEAQLLTLKALPHTGMAVINDIGDANNIHPKNKQEVGRRLAQWALAEVYGKKGVEESGPIYKDFKVEGDKIRVNFDHAEGLKSRDGAPLKQFQITGEDKKWVWADATIDGQSVLVSSKEVPKPVAVRYAWDNNPEGANLGNKADLPASLFRTDDWPGVTANNK